MKRVVIVGCQGMLGQELGRVFGEANYDTRGFDRHRFDFTRRESVEKLLDEFEPDYFINGSAYNAVDKIEGSADEFAKAMEINARAVGQAAALLRERGIPFVHYSSDYVFAGDKESGYSEDELAAAPVNKYGETKLAGEKELKSRTDLYYLIRLSKLFGKPAASPGAKKSFVDTMLSLAREAGRSRLDVVDEELSSPTYAPDLARFTLSLIETGSPYGIYHGANSDAATWYEWAKEIFAVSGISMNLTPAPASSYPRPARRPSHSVLLNTKFIRQRSWQEALREYLKTV